VLRTGCRYGWTALHYAGVEGQFGAVEHLLAAGADVRARDHDGATAAYRAHAAGHDDVACLMSSSVDDDDDDLLTVIQLVDDRQTPQSLYADVRKHAVTGKYTGPNIFSQFIIRSSSSCLLGR